MHPLQHQTAIVTGASSGIGAAVARVLDQAGMNLLVTGRRQKELARVAEGCRSAAVVVGDIADPALPRVLVDEALANFGRCDVLVNNAAVMEVGSVDDIDIERVCTMVRINVEAAYRMAYTFLKHARKLDRGHLVNISSTLGTKVRPGAGAYAGTKFAIEALSEALRVELARTGVRVTVIEPGLVKTHLQDHFKVHPARELGVSRMLEPQDVAQCVRFALEQPPHVRIQRLMVAPTGQPL